MTPQAELIIKPPQEKDKNTWLSMWPDYSNIKPPSQDTLETTWTRLCDHTQNPHGLFLFNKNSGELIGFLHYILHKTTWSTHDTCYMEDAYIVPNHRKKGGFSKLYQELTKLALKNTWHKIYWITRPDNQHAQKIYDRIAQKTDWIRYENKIETAL